jgi:predicted transposase YdaD
MEYNIDDRNRAMEEAQAKLIEAKQVLARLKKQNLLISLMPYAIHCHSCNYFFP